ncbi:MAG: glycosyltransferase N-terminal domain-containing protein [Elusimicrobiaceae bacterium]|nr:glycosyltransferase N-terminal domain-containing protein [Elusimicrobiaceae bacterium]
MTGVFLLIAGNLLFPFIAAGYLVYFFLTPRRGLLGRLASELAQRFVCYGGAADLPVRPVWIHAASVGEVKSISGLTAALKEKYPGRAILLTTSTAAGRAEARKNPCISKAVLAPLDFYPLVTRFIKLFKPSSLILIETELWPNMLTACRMAGVETCIINGRLSAKSLFTYSLVKPMMRLAFKGVRTACLQTEEIAARYEKLGLPKNRITVTGNIKYDRLDESATRTAQVAALTDALGWTGKKILVCGSTHPAEEELLARTFAEISDTIHDYRVIAAPRHLERAEQVCSIFRKAGLATARLTQRDAQALQPAAGTQVLVADTMGWLTSFYGAGTACFVGGTIAPRGGHNLLEAAIAGKPVLFGPHTGNTPETAAKLAANGGGLPVTVENFASSLIQLLNKPGRIAELGRRARETALSYKGATNRTLDALPDSLFK